MVDERTRVQIIDYSLDAGIVGGVVTTALGTALQWGSHANIRAGIFSAAAIGVSSALSLKTQELLINKGLDALVCVESQAEAAYVPVKPVDTALASVAGDIQNLQVEINSIGQAQSEALSTQVRSATADLVNAQNWLTVTSVPVANVVASVKVAADTVLQTTIDQLNQALPDSSAFSKISLSAQPASKGTPPPPPSASTAKSLSINEKEEPEISRLKVLQNNLLGDESRAQNALANIGSNPAATQLPTINCPVASGTPTQTLQISSSSLTISLSSTKPPDPLTINGGAPPYKAEITTAANATGLNPKAIQVGLAGTTITLTYSAALTKGTYNLVVTDATGIQRTATIMVNP
jgi:hypothetical protein